MRILFVMSTLTGAGAERQTSYLAAELQRRGHEVLTAFLYEGSGEWPDELPAHRLPQRRPSSPRRRKVSGAVVAIAPSLDSVS